MREFLFSVAIVTVLKWTAAQTADSRCSNPLEVWSQCNAQCQATCQDPSSTNPCIEICTPGCICREGLVRSLKGECIPPRECTDPRCSRPEEEWSQCEAQCQATCADPTGSNPCVDVCTPGCVCKKGLVRTGRGTCIPPGQCTPTSMRCPGQNEVLDSCGANGCQNTCKEPARMTYCNPYGCSFGCICQKGYMRNDKGNCTWAEDCVKCEDPFAHWSNTDATACQNTCERPDLSTYCRPIAPEAGCVCNTGYLKSSDGKCLPAESCGHCDDPNAVYSLTLATPCQNTCQEPNKQSDCRPLRAEAGCICKKGFVKNDKGKCVRLTECRSTVCGINEHFEQCARTCPPEDCESIGKQFYCSVQPPLDCKSECKCDLNHKRDKRGICIPIARCPPLQCTNEFEIYDPCPPQCPDNTCSALGTNIKCVNIVNATAECLPNCRCMPGYYRKFVNGISSCVPESECRACSGDNEEYSDTGPSCEPSCSSLYKQPICIQAVKSGCFCKKGYVRDAFDKCILPTECYQDLCGDNEERSCGLPCDRTCASLNVSCPIASAICAKMCYCKEGYARNDCGKCIPIKECPANRGCNGDPNAIRSKCGSPCPETCHNIELPKQPCPAVCIVDECQCKSGYVLHDESGRCVRPSECSLCTGPNEVWSSDQECSCTNLVDKTAIATRPTSAGCRCKDGYVRDAEGICIQAGTCPRCSTKEVYTECGSACPITCMNRNNPPSACIAVCVKGCFCKPGLMRNEQGECVEANKCPISCGGDIHAQNTTHSPSCKKTCDNYKIEDLQCSQIFTTEGCNCIEGYVLDTTTNRCIRPSECPAGCGGDVNAQHVPCGNTCPITCNNIGEPRVCTKNCILGGGCSCKPGYVQGGPFNKCILPEQCPHCGDHEIYDCGSACQTTCATLNEVCPIINIRCNDGCYCEEGYARNAYGICIPIDKCPPKKGCKSDLLAHNESCPGALCSVTCADYQGSTEPTHCKEACPTSGKCVCNKGKVLDEVTQFCVEPNDCHKCTGQNEAFWNSTEVTCNELTSPDFHGLIAHRKRSLGCHCKPGFVRNNVGECIPSQRCPRCGPLEQYTECGSACPKTCSEPSGRVICTTQCIVGCFCKEPMIRNNLGECVLPEKCEVPYVPGCGGDINASNGTFIAGCVPTCNNPEALEKCLLTPQTRSVGCVCNTGYIFDDVTKKCVLRSECPLGCDGDINAMYNACGDACGLTCDNMHNPPMCPLVCRVDSGACGCKPNFVRNRNGRCVMPTECHNHACGPNEHLEKCPTDCPPETCSAIGRVYKCAAPSTHPSQCHTSSCRCNKNYRRNDLGDCVPIQLCPPLECSKPNEVYDPCPMECPGETCNDALNPGSCKPDFSSFMTCKPACRCRVGFFRTFRGNCGTMHDCYLRN